MRWLDGIINAMDVSLSKLQEIVKNREVWCAVFLGSQRVTCYCILKLEFYHCFTSIINL